MLASTWSIRFFSLALVKFLSRAFTALNLLPSIAATAWVNRSSRRHRSMNLRQVARIAGPASRFRNNALKPQHLQVQLIDEHVDHSDRVLLRHIVVQELRKQNALP